MMRRTVALVLFVVVSAITQADAARQSVPQSLVTVQAVDSGWLPIPGATVTLRNAGGTLVSSATTNAEGFGRISLPTTQLQSQHHIDASMAGFKTTTMTRVVFGTCERDCRSSHYVQLVLQVGGPTITLID